MMFKGRRDELESMEKIYSGKGLKSLAVYGRRRVGKTSLLNEFCKNKRTIFFSARESSETINLRVFAEALSAAAGLTLGEFRDFESAMKATADICRKEKTVLVIDELPFLVEASPYFPSTLQHYMDREFADLDLMVVICGSSVGTMDDIINGKQKPLFGRFGRQMRLESFDYMESLELMQGEDRKTQAEIYGITGGTPPYLTLMSEKGFKDAVIDNFLSPTAPLREEPANLLRQEFKNPSRYISIICAISEGNTQINKISEVSGVDQSTCSRYISSLETVGIVRKEEPMSNSKRRPVYEISDGLFRFRYGVIEKIYPLIIAGDTDRAHAKTAEMMPDFMGRQFEEICRQYVRRNTRYSKIGKWWGSDPDRKTDAEIDIVAADGTDMTADVLFGSCKYRSKPIGVQDLDDLVRTSSLVTGFRKRSYIMFSLSGFTEDLKAAASASDTALIDLNGLYMKM